MKERLNVTKYIGGDVSVPMAMMRKSADGYGNLPMIRRESSEAAGGLWKSFSLSRGIVSLFP